MFHFLTRTNGRSSAAVFGIALFEMTTRIAFILALAAPVAGVSTAQTAKPVKNYTPADVHFVAGMIGHHAQAIQMAGWAPSHGASPSVRVLCERIVVAQNDEIAFAQRWLREHGEYVPPADPRGHIMQGMDHPMLMAGMLTPEQMAQLDSARGTQFDRLLRTFMIQPHPGAVRLSLSARGVRGMHVLQGNFGRVAGWHISNPKIPRLYRAFVCPGSQSGVSFYRNVLFVSGDALNGRTDCGTQGVADTVSHDRLRGIRIFDITDIANPRHITDVQTCRGSHTHTVVTSPTDTANVYIYVSGSAPVRSPNELAGCSSAPPDSNPNSALFRIEVIQVPLAHPEQARIVSSPRIFNDLTQARSHGETPEDIAAAARAAAEARAHGGFTATIQGTEIVLGPGFIRFRLDSIMKARGGNGAPSAADSAALRAGLQDIVNRRREANRRRQGPPTGPTQCHDITVYPASGLAGGAGGGDGLLVARRPAASPKRIAAVADSNFSFWHSAT